MFLTKISVFLKTTFKIFSQKNRCLIFNENELVLFIIFNKT
jgi:hypothetical protein